MTRQATHQYLQEAKMIYMYQELFPIYIILLILVMSQAQGAKRINIFSRSSRITVHQPIGAKGSDIGQDSIMTIIHHAEIKILGRSLRGMENVFKQVFF